jgi:NAD(P)-dependent dehydrogenase (short-subunit alcohol dehydrogenase family)
MGFAYDASKTALNAFTVHLAHELKGTPGKVNSAILMPIMTRA